jgi:PBSX family phage portal protein
MSESTDIIPTAPAQVHAPGSGGGGRVFTFGDPESVMDGRELWSYFEMWKNGRWYEPPMPMTKLAKSFNMSPHHRSAIALKVNLLLKYFTPTRWLDRANFERWAIDFLQMGNAYLERIDNLGGRVMTLRHSPAIFTRVGSEPGTMFFVKGPLGHDHEFRPNSVFHLLQPDVSQEVYGVPEWLSALQAGLLNENATLFRRRYYLNGAHAGFILYLSDPLADGETADAIEERLGSAKGIGNFKNMFLHIPNGKKDGIQVIPIADVAAKDEFLNIKNVTRDDLLAAHRVPPQLIGIIPQNNGGFGDVGKASDTFFENEIEPIQQRMRQLNEWLGVEALVFAPRPSPAQGARPR